MKLFWRAWAWYCRRRAAAHEARVEAYRAWASGYGRLPRDGNVIDYLYESCKRDYWLERATRVEKLCG